MKARVINNEAVEVCADPSAIYHPDIAAQFVTVPATTLQGCRYDPATKKWAAPEGVVDTIIVGAGVRKLSPLAYLRRFTISEEGAIRTAAKNDETLGVILARTDRATYIDLDDPDTVGGLDYIVSKGGLLTELRKLEILNAPVTAAERP